jgi:RHS repeat-associated protein
MRNIIIITILCALFLSISGELVAQSTVPFVNTSTSALSGTTTLQARSLITLGAGFSYTPSGGTFATQIVDPLIIGLAEYSANQINPLTRSLTTSYKPGTLPGSVDVSQVGSAGYTIPIEVPKGIDGFQPSLAVSYSSMAGDGTMGKGWNLAGLGAITRISSSTYFDNAVNGINFDLGDRFALNGQRLILNGGTYGSPGTQYWLEQDQSVKITYASGSADYFTVQTSDGTTYEYGNTPDSKVAGTSSSTLKWHLNKITNNNGQVINISYIVTNGWAYPALVKYGVSTIEFYYKNRDLPLFSYIKGNYYSMPYLLDNIQVWNNGTISRKFTFSYFKTTANESPLLSEIGFYGMNNERLNSTVFKYDLNYAGTPTIVSPVNTTHDIISYKAKIVSGDFNGDGKTDLLCIPNPTKGATWTTWKFYQSNGDGSFTPNGERSVAYSLNEIPDISAIDLTGDGRDEVIFERVVTENKILYSYFYFMLNEDGILSFPYQICKVLSDQKTGFWNKFFRLSDLHDNSLNRFSDFNGDGINEVFISYKGGNWGIYSISQSGSVSTLGSGTNSTLSDEISVGDFNGDGKAEIWDFQSTGLQIYYFNGSILYNVLSSALTTRFHYFSQGDFNGDGKTDLLIHGDYNGVYHDYTNWQMFLSTGASFHEIIIPQLMAEISGKDVRVTDLNGDGASDLMVTGYNGYCNGANFFISRNGGTAFSSITVPENQLLGSNLINLGDFNGDGCTDFLSRSNSTTPILGYCYFKTPGKNQDLLTELSNGLGHYSKITYVPISHNNASTIYTKGTMASFPLLTFQGPLNVVSKVESNNGIGGTLAVSYKYEGAKIHRQGKGFMGFSKVTTTNEATGIISENNYEINTTYYYPKLMSSIVKYGTSGNINTTSNLWAEKVFSGSKRFIPYVYSSTSTNNLTNFATTTTTSEPDIYGNLQSQSVAYTNGPTHTKTIVYNNDATNWLVARPCSLTTTQAQSGDANIVQLVTTTYETGKVKPDIVTYFDGTTQKKRLNYDYNTNGTPSALHELSTDLTEQHTYYAFDANGINLIKKMYPDGTRDTITYFGNGLVNKVTDYWGNSTTYSYDNFSNDSTVLKTGGIGIASNKLAFVTTPTNARYSVTQTMTDGSQSVVYYDVLGREIRKGTKLFDGTIACTQTDYNALGQAYRVSEPFLPPNNPSLWNTTTFDNYGRVATITPSVGASSTYSYNGGITKVESNGRTDSTIVTNATGWITRRRDMGGSISYLYKADGNVKQITAPGSVVTTMTYDAFGNQLTLNDPSAGNTTYTYYGGGELRTQVTPLGTTTNNYQADGKIDYYTNPAGTYDYTYGNNKQVSSITSPGSVSRSYTYLSNGKVDEISETIETGQTNKVKFVYDRFGRDSIKTYTNSNNVTRNEKYLYNSYGYLDQVLFNGAVVYDVSTMDIRGNITGATIGNTTIGSTPVTWGYNSYGQLTSINASGVQNYSFTPNTTTGNLTSRSNIQVTPNLNESFYYDNLDRLTTAIKNGTDTLSIGYDSGGKGNIVTKRDAGTLLYDLSNKPYAVGHVNPYTANFPSVNQSATYTSFGKVNTLTEGVYSASFKYNSDNKRVKMVITQSGTAIKTKYYFGNSYEKVIEGGVTTEYIWIGGSPYTAVAVAKINGTTTTIYRIFRDNLGTITHLKSSSETLEYSFDAYGRRRDKDNWSYTIDDTNALFADRGFTGHEHLTQFGLINMNGRLYDPLVGRFLSPDNYVQSPDFTQNFNRYSYCLNNPLRYTDPSGQIFVVDDILVAAAFGAFINLVCQDMQGNVNTTGDFFSALGIGALAGAAGGVAGQAVAGAISFGGFAGGALTGGAGGAAGGFVGGAGNAWMNGANFGSGISAGLIGGGIGALTGGLTGGLIKGISDYRNGYSFWNGSKVDELVIGSAQYELNANGYNSSSEANTWDEYLKLRMYDEFGFSEGDFNVSDITTRTTKGFGMTTDGNYIDIGSKSIVGGYRYSTTTGYQEIHISPYYTKSDVVNFRAVAGHEIIHAFHHYTLPSFSSVFSERVAYKYTHDVYMNNGNFSSAFSTMKTAMFNSGGSFWGSYPAQYQIPSPFRFY